MIDADSAALFKELDPQRLIFGERYDTFNVPNEILEEAAKVVDVISVQPCFPECSCLSEPRSQSYRGQIPLQQNEVKLEVRVGARDGEKLGEFYPHFTGGSEAFREMVATLEPTELAGPQTLYFVIRSATGKPVGTIDWISLEKAQEPMDMNGLGIEPLNRDGQFVFPEPTHRPLPPDIRRLPSRLRQKLESPKK